ELTVTYWQSEGSRPRADAASAPVPAPGQALGGRGRFSDNDSGDQPACKGTSVGALLKASRIIDAINDRFGTLANYLVLFACLISAGNAVSRYAFSLSSNA